MMNSYTPKMDKSVVVMADRIIQTRSGGMVERGHCIPHQGSYNNAAHSWGVAMLMHAIWPEDFKRLVLVCLAHDVAESWVGDIPAPILRYSPEFRTVVGGMENTICASLGLPREDQLPPEDHAKLKACDRLELYLWCREQQAIGNTFIKEFLTELTRYFIETPLPFPADKLFKHFEFNTVLPRYAGIIKALEKASHDKE